MGAQRIGNLYLATVESIDANKGRCGCQITKDGYSVWLCQYHDGYEDGIERALRLEQGYTPFKTEYWDAFAPPGTIPTTGGDTAAPLSIAAIVLAAGGGLILLARRRPT